jgi:hypothetical protein
LVDGFVHELQRFLTMATFIGLSSKLALGWFRIIDSQCPLARIRAYWLSAIGYSLFGTSLRRVPFLIDFFKKLPKRRCLPQNSCGNRTILRSEVTPLLPR